jgi:hypothetical protein
LGEAHVTGVVPLQMPATQLSTVVHWFPSSQPSPSGLAGLLHVPVLGLQTPSVWHWSSNVQPTVPLPVQTPALHVSVGVHLLPSSQPVPSVLAGLLQMPVAASHTPAVWHWSSAVQPTAPPPVQMPVLHVSVLVQALLSLQTVPSVLLGFEQAPVAGLQLPTSWHWSLAVHVTRFLPTHVPAAQASVRVQASLSLQVVPSMTGTALQAPALHVPVLHASLSAEQSTGVPAVHLPALVSQVRPVTHGSVLQSVSFVQLHLLKSWAQPVGSTQLSTLQPSESAQLSAPPPHTPVVHLSPVVQTLPSLHSVPSVCAGFVQVPSVGSHVPTLWHWSRAVHVTELALLHTPT